MELAIPDIPFPLRLHGVEAVLTGVVVTIYLAVSAHSNGPHDVDSRGIEGEREVLLLCGRNGLGRDFDDLECSHRGVGAARGATKSEGEEEARVREVGMCVEEGLGVWSGRRRLWLWEEEVRAFASTRSVFL